MSGWAALAGRAGILTSAFYAALFFGLGAHLPYWPLWLADWGLDQAAIGWLMGLAVLARVAGGTLLPALADQLAARRLMLALCGAAAGVAALLHALAESMAALTLLTVTMGFASSPLIGLGEALGLRAANQHGFAYAHARAVGSLSFLAMVWGLGALIGVVGSGSVLTVIALCFFAAAALGLIHPGGGAPPGQSDRATMAEAATLLRSRLFQVFALSAALGHAAHAVYYTYSVVAWREAGIAAFWVGALWASGVLAEIVLMLGPGRRWIATIGPARGLALAGLAGLLRWSAMTLEPVGPLLWVAQILHAGSFGIAHLAAMAFIAAAVPARLGGTAQGLANGLIGGLTLAGATMLAGIGVPYLGLGGIYWIAAALALTATIFALVLALSWRGGRILD